MKCPCCNEDMEIGTLEGQRYLLWSKANRPYKLTYRPKKGDVLLGERIVNSVVANAYICKQCKKIVLDYADLRGVKEG